MQDKKRSMQIMIESLQKKEKVLDDIIAANERQTEIITEQQPDWEAFDEQVDVKTELIGKLDLLDEGFEGLYNTIKDLLADPSRKDEYAAEVKQMQQLIKILTDKSMSIQAAEARNKQMMEAKFEGQRREIKVGRTSSRVALDYYNNMRQTGMLQSQFLDSKK